MMSVLFIGTSFITSTPQWICQPKPRDDLDWNDLGEGGGRVLAEALRVNNTLALLKLYYNDLGKGGGRALAETLRLNTTVTSLKLGINGRKRAEGGRW
jgi:hypothetical protein